MGVDRKHRERKEAFKRAVEPFIKWMAENCHPHTTTIVDSTHAELVEGCMVHKTEEFLTDVDV